MVFTIAPDVLRWMVPASCSFSSGTRMEHGGFPNRMSWRRSKQPARCRTPRGSSRPWEVACTDSRCHHGHSSSSNRRQATSTILVHIQLGGRNVKRTNFFPMGCGWTGGCYRPSVACDTKGGNSLMRYVVDILFVHPPYPRRIELPVTYVLF